MAHVTHIRIGLVGYYPEIEKSCLPGGKGEMFPTYFLNFLNGVMSEIARNWWIV